MTSSTPALPLATSREGLPRETPTARTAPAAPPLGGTALARPQIGLLEAIGAWLASARRLFVVRRRRKPAIKPAPWHNGHGTQHHRGGGRHAPQPTLRERTELIQLQAENRRLRQQIERLAPRGDTAQGNGTIIPLATARSPSAEDGAAPAPLRDTAPRLPEGTRH